MAKKEIVTYSQQTFENIKHTDENGTEFWYARELQTALEYAQWRRFQESIVRAKTACEASGLDVEDHFADVGKMINLAKGAQREIIAKLQSKGLIKRTADIIYNKHPATASIYPKVITKTLEFLLVL